MVVRVMIMLLATSDVDELMLMLQLLLAPFILLASLDFLLLSFPLS